MYKIRERIQRPDQRLFEAIVSYSSRAASPKQHKGITSCKVVLNLKTPLTRPRHVVKQEVSYRPVTVMPSISVCLTVGIMASERSRDACKPGTALQEISNKQQVRDVGEVIQERSAEVHSEDAPQNFWYKGANHSNT